MHAPLTTTGRKPGEVVYPDSDGQPMADNTLQFEWIVMLKTNLDRLFRDRDDVFVAGDLLWYPVEGDNSTRRAPDAMVVIGRPKGYRGSYRQWEEGDVAPQVVFEVLSPGNTIAEMVRKFQFYDRHGVAEYYLYDPYQHELVGWQRAGTHLDEIPSLSSWVSPNLGIRFVPGEGPLRLFFPDGRPFLSFLEVDAEREQALRRAADEQFAKEEALRQLERLQARLRELGHDPGA
jgi:Uma2 family endonuclease